MPLRAAFFDVGDTLVEHWAPGDVMRAKQRARVLAELGETEWLDELLAADLEPPHAKIGWPYQPENERQRTNDWYAAWFRGRGIEPAVEIDRLRALMCLPIAEISRPVRGAFEAIRWCAEHGLRVVIVTNTLMRGDEEVLADWRRAGLEDAIAGYASSHSVGWRKPHPAIFERALAIVDARPAEAFHVGDNLVADVWGAQQLGLRTVWRRKAAVPRPVDVRPDAVVEDLTELPAVVAGWLAGEAA